MNNKYICLLLNLIFSLWLMQSFAANIIPDYSISSYDQVIQKIYANPQINTIQSKNLTKRLEIISAFFLGKPYLYGALGEGQKALFDQHPLYRTDAFDCLTYVSMVLALSESRNLTEFKKNILKIQYFNANPTFVNRLHFTDADWNRANAQNGYIQDITMLFKNRHGESIAQIAEALIDKPSWYQKMTENRLNFIYPLSPKQEKQRLSALRALSSQVKSENIRIPYLPLTALFDKKGQPNLFIFNQIPSGSIIEIVRPNWNLKNIIGTNLNISHLGFVFRTSQGLIFREASSLEHRVMDVNLIAYLYSYYDSPTVKGINVQLVKIPSGDFK